MTLLPTNDNVATRLLRRLLLIASFVCVSLLLSVPTLAVTVEQPAPPSNSEPIDKQNATETPTNDLEKKIDPSPDELEKSVEKNNKPKRNSEPNNNEKSDSARTESTKELASQPLELPTLIRPTDYLLLPRVGDYRRGPLHVDPIEHLLLGATSFQPRVGDEVLSASGVKLFWQTEEKPPSERLLIGGYAFTTFESPIAGTMLLDAQGCAALNLNGQWIAGNPYGISVPNIPVSVNKGINTLLVHLAKPNARPVFIRPPTAIFFDEANSVLPDVVASRLETGDFQIDSPLLVASLPLTNTSDETLSNLQIHSQLGDAEPLRSDVDDLPARSVVRVPFKIRAFKGETSDKKLKLLIKLKERPDAEGVSQPSIAKTEISLELKAIGSLQSHTFVSKVDSSVQRYAYLPAKEEEQINNESKADDPQLVVQLHDAGDDCLALLSESKALLGVHQIAPQGRGNFGFDWEDWSAIDVFEAVADLRQKLGLKTEPLAISGQGMGGHGALWIAANHPDQFAAVESSLGWLNLLLPSEETPNDPRLKKLRKLINRRSRSADLFGLVSNLEATSIRLHQNKNGSPTAMAEIRELRSELGKFHSDFSYQENSISVAKQSEVAATALTASLTRRETLNANEIEFATPDLSLQSEIAWVKIDAIEEQGSLARVRILRDPTLGTFRGSTENIRRLTLSLTGMKEVKKIQVRLDSQKPIRIDWPARSSLIQIERDEKGDWGLPTRPQSFFRRLAKTPDRHGGMKSVFANNPLLVYGTQGAEEENQWAEAKARYDANLFRYRGSGRLDFIADRQFSPEKYRDRSLILYGNFDTNSVAKRMLARSRVKVFTGRIDVGPRPELGDDLAVLLVQPRRDSRTASIALVGGTGIKGMQATTRLRYFWSGVHYPDLFIFGSEALKAIQGQSPIDNVRAAGYLGPLWGLQESEINWRDVAF